MDYLKNAFLTLALAAAISCSPGSNTQFEPIGSRCTSDGTCGTSPFVCATALPGGYCEKRCGTDGDCPSDAVCFESTCRRRCASDSECRESEGYQCRAEGATSSFCDIAASP